MEEKYGTKAYYTSDLFICELAFPTFFCLYTLRSWTEQKTGWLGFLCEIP